MRDGSIPAYVWRWTLTALLCSVAVWWVLGHWSLRYASVGISWDPATPVGVRESVERRAGMVLIEFESSLLARYFVSDPSPSALGALFGVPWITGVRHVERSTGVPTRWERASVSEWLDRRYGFDSLDYLRPMAVGPLLLLAVGLSLLARPDGRAWLCSRVPRIDPATLGVYRVVLAVGLMTTTWAAPMASGWKWAGLGLLLLFGAGVQARVSYALFLLLFAYAVGPELADHNFTAPFQAWVLGLLVPWRVGVGLDETRRRLVGAPSQEGAGFGLVIVPMMFGLAYLAAAFAKLDQGWREWLTGGAVRYFIALDGPTAPGHLWRLVASSDWASLVLSPLVIVIETIVIAAAIQPRARVLVVSGVCAIVLHLGFFVLQGVWWPAWWALLPAFLPWPAIVARLRGSMPSVAVEFEQAQGQGDVLAKWLHALDWFDRVSIRMRQPAASRPAAGSAGEGNGPLQEMTVVDERSGERWTGNDAMRRLRRLLPLTGWLLPLGRTLWVRRMASQRIDPGVRGPAEGLPWWVGAAFGVVIIQQACASFLRVEYLPLLSNYPMYANVSWTSKEAFAAYMEEQEKPREPAVRLYTDPGDAVAVNSRLRTIPDCRHVRLMVPAAIGRLAAEAGAARDCRHAYAELYGEATPRLVVQVSGWRFDWSAAGFVPVDSWESDARQ